MSTYETALGICQLTLSMERETSGKSLTREQIANKVDELLSIPTFSSGVDREALIRELEELYTVWSNDPSALSNDDDHKPWLPSRRAEIKWLFWSRYKTFLTQRVRMLG